MDFLPDACRGAVGQGCDRRVLVAGADIAAADHLIMPGAEGVDGDLSTFLERPGLDHLDDVRLDQRAAQMGNPSSDNDRGARAAQHAGTYEAVRAQMLDALRRDNGDGAFSTTSRYRVIKLRRR